MAEQEVKTKFGFEVDDKPLHDLQHGIDALKEGLFGLTASLVESGFALYETVVKTSEAGEAAIKLGQQTGVGTQKIQELQYAARSLGVDADGLSHGLTFLNRNMFNVIKGGGGLNDAFTRFGINIHQANGQLRPADQVLGDIADRFQKLPDGPEKSGLAMQFFGRQGAALIPILNKGKSGIAELGAEAQSLGYVLSDQDAENGKKFQEALKVLMAALVGIRNIVASDLMPAFTEIVESITDWIKANRKLIQTDLKAFLQGTAHYLGIIFKVFLQVGESLQGFTRLMGGAENATKAFLYVVGLLAGASILFGIGKLIQSIYAMATAFSVADATALLIPIAIGLLIVAIGLVAEDLYQYFTGGDSVFGRMIASLSPFLTMFIDGLRNIGATILTVVLMPLRMLLAILGDVINLIGKIPGLGGLKKVGDFVGNIGTTLLDTSNLFVPGTNPGAAGNQPSNNVNVNAPITVTVPEGTPPGLVGDRVSEGVAMGVDNHLRQAQRATLANGVY